MTAFVIPDNLRTWIDTRSVKIECPPGLFRAAHEVSGFVWLSSIPSDDLHPMDREGSQMIIRACGPFDLEPGKPFELKSDMGIVMTVDTGVDYDCTISGVDVCSNSSRLMFSFILENKTDTTIHFVKGQPVLEIGLFVRCSCGYLTELPADLNSGDYPPREASLPPSLLRYPNPKRYPPKLDLATIAPEPKPLWQEPKLKWMVPTPELKP